MGTSVKSGFRWGHCQIWSAPLRWLGWKQFPSAPEAWIRVKSRKRNKLRIGGKGSCATSDFAMDRLKSKNNNFRTCTVSSFQQDRRFFQKLTTFIKFKKLTILRESENSTVDKNLKMVKIEKSRFSKIDHFYQIQKIDNFERIRKLNSWQILKMVKLEKSRSSTTSTNLTVVKIDKITKRTS